MNSFPLQRLSRDIRVTRPWRSVRGSRARGSRVAAFVASLLARHARGVTTLFGPERVMRRQLAHAVAARHYHQGDTTRLALRFDIRLAPVTRTRAEAAPFLPWRATPDGDAAPTARPTAHSEMVRRIVARDRRVRTATTMREVLREATAPQATLAGAQAVPPPPLPRTRPVEMVVHRPRNPAYDASARTPPTLSTRPETEERTVLPVIRQAATASPQLSVTELGRVTDHVVRAIDRRFVAQRERRGRI